MYRWNVSVPRFLAQRSTLRLQRCMSSRLQDDPALMYPEPPMSVYSSVILSNCLSSRSSPLLPNEKPRVSLLMELTDGVGVLHNVLRYFWKYNINVSRIESRPVEGQKFDFFVDFDGKRDEENVEQLLMELRPMTEKLLILDEKEVSQKIWYKMIL